MPKKKKAMPGASDIELAAIRAREASVRIKTQEKERKNAKRLEKKEEKEKKKRDAAANVSTSALIERQREHDASVRAAYQARAGEAG